MDHHQPPLVWYLLIDSSTGLPYKGTTADSVSVHSEAYVVQFRDEVKKKNPNKLSSFDASDLIVYKNMAAFEKRNSDGQDKQEPLQADSCVEGLGKSVKEALIVVVPMDERTPQTLPLTVDRYLDVSYDLYKNLTSPFDREPNLQELPVLLLTDPLTQFPIPRYIYVRYLPSVPYFEKICRPSSQEVCNMDGSLIQIIQMIVQLDGQGGDSLIHYYTDSLIKEILVKLLSPTLATYTSRDVVDFSSTTLSGARPDFLFYVNQFLILRGEEKKSQGDLEIAQAELIQKLTKWNVHRFGSLNYIFGFACAGDALTFHAMSPSGELANISPIFSLTSVAHRIQIIIFVINLSRLIRTLAYRIPQGLPRLYYPIERANGCTIVIHYDYVLKTIPVPFDVFQRTYAYLNEIYSVLRREKVPHVIELTNSSWTIVENVGYIFLKVTPCGIQRVPKTNKELLSALKSVLLALEGIHKLGYAHRDVRWPNVLSVTDEDWMLIDFENSSKDVDSSLKNKDMQMLGEMMRQCGLLFKSSEVLCALYNQLISENPPDASAALTFLFQDI